jgi:diguanylate cyclase (GGDEF)-like protein
VLQAISTFGATGWFDFMQQKTTNRVPEKWKFIGIFIVTSLFGVLLISVAVYNASRELELILEIDNLDRFNRLHIDKVGENLVAARGDPALPFPELHQLAINDFHLYLLNGDQIVNIVPGNEDFALPVYPAALEASRINERGGYLEAEGKTYTWSMSPLSHTRSQLILLHEFQQSGLQSLVFVYSKRILIPAAFYVWLMVWVSLILSFLINKLKSQSDAMEHMALHDPLSGLPNRHLLSDSLNQLMQSCRRRGTSFALALIDLDRFKQVNDTLGHEYGDELLRQVAERIKQALRKSDTAARLGGDEFVLLLDGTDRGSYWNVCQRVESVLNEPYRISAANISVGCSMGVAVFPAHGEDRSTLMRKADQAMYAAKGDGGGVRICEHNLQENLRITG